MLFDHSKERVGAASGFRDGLKPSSTKGSKNAAKCVRMVADLPSTTDEPEALPGTSPVSVMLDDFMAAPMAPGVRSTRTPKSQIAKGVSVVRAAANVPYGSVVDSLPTEFLAGGAVRAPSSPRCRHTSAHVDRSRHVVQEEREARQALRMARPRTSLKQLQQFLADNNVERKDLPEFLASRTL